MKVVIVLDLSESKIILDKAVAPISCCYKHVHMGQIRFSHQGLCNTGIYQFHPTLPTHSSMYVPPKQAGAGGAVFINGNTRS